MAKLCDACKKLEDFAAGLKTLSAVAAKISDDKEIDEDIKKEVEKLIDSSEDLKKDIEKYKDDCYCTDDKDDDKEVPDEDLDEMEEKANTIYNELSIYAEACGIDIQECVAELYADNFDPYCESGEDFMFDEDFFEAFDEFEDDIYEDVDFSEYDDKFSEFANVVHKADPSDGWTPKVSLASIACIGAIAVYLGAVIKRINAAKKFKKQMAIINKELDDKTLDAIRPLCNELENSIEQIDKEIKAKKAEIEDIKSKVKSKDIKILDAYKKINQCKKDIQDLVKKSDATIAKARAVQAKYKQLGGKSKTSYVEAVEDAKLSVYESVDSGLITEAESEFLLDCLGVVEESKRTFGNFGEVRLRGLKSDDEEKSKFANSKLLNNIKDTKYDEEKDANYDQSIVRAIKSNKTRMESVCSTLDNLVGRGVLTEEQADKVYDLACCKYMEESRRLDKEIIKKADKIKALQNEINKNPDMTDQEKANLLGKINRKEILPAYKDYDYKGKDPVRLTVSRFKQLQNEMKQNPESRIKIIDDDKVDKIHRVKTNLITKDHKVHDLTPAKEKEPGKYLKELKKRNLVKAVDNL